MLQASGKEIVAALTRAGWVRMKSGGGSHVKLQRPNGSGRVVVPLHGNRSLPPGTLKGVLQMAGLTEEELRGLL